MIYFAHGKCCEKRKEKKALQFDVSLIHLDDFGWMLQDNVADGKQ